MNACPRAKDKHALGAPSCACLYAGKAAMLAPASSLKAHEKMTPPSTHMYLGPVFDIHPENTLWTIDPVKMTRSGRRCLVSTEEPACFEDATINECWRQAMEEEFGSIHDNIAWELVDLPNNHKAMDLK